MKEGPKNDKNNESFSTFPLSSISGVIGWLARTVVITILWLMLLLRENWVRWWRVWPWPEPQYTGPSSPPLTQMAPSSSLPLSGPGSSWSAVACVWPGSCWGRRVPLVSVVIVIVVVMSVGGGVGVESSRESWAPCQLLEINREQVRVGRQVFQSAVCCPRHHTHWPYLLLSCRSVLEWWWCEERRDMSWCHDNTTTMSLLSVTGNRLIVPSSLVSPSLSLDKIIPIIPSRDLKWNVNRKSSLHLKLFPRIFSNESDISSVNIEWKQEREESTKLGCSRF